MSKEPKRIAQKKPKVREENGFVYCAICGKCLFIHEVPVPIIRNCPHHKWVRDEKGNFRLVRVG